MRLRLTCWWRGHLLTPPYRYRQLCGRCGRCFGSMDPPKSTEAGKGWGEQEWGEPTPEGRLDSMNDLDATRIRRRFG